MSWDGLGLVEKQIRFIADRLACDYDGILIHALNYLAPGWTLENIKHRVQRVRMVGADHECWYLDGEMFLQVWDPVSDGRQLRPYMPTKEMTVSFKLRYRYVGPAADVTVK